MSDLTAGDEVILAAIESGMAPTESQIRFLSAFFETGFGAHLRLIATSESPTTKETL